MSIQAFIHPELAILYNKSVQKLSEDITNCPEGCLSIDEVLKAHFLIADFFILKEKELVELDQKY